MAIEHQWINEAAHLEEFCASISEGDIVAIDTESDHFFAYRPYVALIQLATVEEAALIDPLALSEDDLEPLLALVDDASVVKIMHSARNDIGELDRDWGVAPQSVFDTQLAARFLNYEKFSLDALLGVTAGIKLNKKYQRFDWARRPIPAEARDYAVQDVVHLFDLRARLLRELEAEGWLDAFREHTEHLIASSGYQETPFDTERWRKLKGAKELDDRGRAALAALYEYRHELCDQIDRAPLHVFDNGALVAVARARPTSLAALERIKGVRTQTARRNGADILAVLRAAEDAPIPPAKPPRTGGSNRRRTPQEKARLSAMLQLRHELAAQVNLPVDFIAARDALEEIATLGPQSSDDLGGIERLMQWQRELFGDQLVQACKSNS